MPAQKITSNGHHPGKSMVGWYTEMNTKAKLLIAQRRDGLTMTEWGELCAQAYIEDSEKRHGPMRLPGELLERVKTKIGERGAKLSRRKVEKRPPSFWQALDWSKRNRDIAEELKVAPQWVSVMRGRYASLRRQGIDRK